MRIFRAFLPFLVWWTVFTVGFVPGSFLIGKSWGAGPEALPSAVSAPPAGGFHKNETSVGFALGGGLGVRAFGGEERHDFLEALVRVGWVFSDVMAPGHWYAGNWELLGEIFGGPQVHPRTRYFVGLTPVLRYTFALRPWAPFLNAGAGVSATDIQGPDLSHAFQFNLQAGGGVHYFLREKTAVTLEYRWLHFSNAGMSDPNLGTNTQMLLMGVNWYY